MNILIDGSRGEGGGQILRTSLSLSALTGRSFRMFNIRARRARPGLRRQHLTALRAAAEICGAELSGASLGSASLEFKPGRIRGCERTFTTGTAGSATLVFQTVLYPLLHADEPSTLKIIGGTHNMAAPPADFLLETFLPLLARMGAKIEANCDTPGFFPAGGGRLRVRIEPVRNWEPLEVIDCCGDCRIRAKVLVSQLNPNIARREAGVLASELGIAAGEVEIVDVTDSPGPGNVVMVFVKCGAVTETFTAFGRLGYPAERVAEDAAREAKTYMTNRAPVGPYLADQLLLPLVLSGRGAFCTRQLTPHTRTNIETIGLFIDKRISVVQRPNGNYMLKVS